MTYSQKKSENFQNFTPGNEKDMFRQGLHPGGMDKQNERKVNEPEIKGGSVSSFYRT